MYNIEVVHYVIDEMVLNGCIADANKTNVLAPVRELQNGS